MRIKTILSIGFNALCFLSLNGCQSKSVSVSFFSAHTNLLSRILSILIGLALISIIEKIYIKDMAVNVRDAFDNFIRTLENKKKLLITIIIAAVLLILLNVICF